MLRRLLSSLLLFAAPLAPLAAQGFYAGAQFGYGIATTNDVFTNTDEERNATGQTISRKNIYGTVGGGFTAQANVGYFVNPHLRFDLGFYYLLGKESLNRRLTTPTETYTGHVSTQQMRLTPSIVVQTGHGKVQPYARFGIVVPVGGKTTSTERYEHATNGDNSIKVTEIRGAFSLGFESGAGIAYNATDNLSITAEIVYTGLRIKSATAEVVEWETNFGGVSNNEIEDANTIALQTTFVDALTNESNNLFVNSTGTINNDAPFEELARRVNFSAVALRVGAIYRFGSE